MSKVRLTFDALTKRTQDDNPFVLKGEWLYVQFENLISGDFYVAPFFYWAREVRPVRVEIFDPNDITKIVKEFYFKVGPNTLRGHPRWNQKRYKLNDQRHNGRALLRIGFESEEQLPELLVAAAPLTSRKIKRQRRVAAGLCPECSNEGHWKAMAMVCPEHGPFLGGAF